MNRLLYYLLYFVVLQMFTFQRVAVCDADANRRVIDYDEKMTF